MISFMTLPLFSIWPFSTFIYPCINWTSYWCLYSRSTIIPLNMRKYSVIWATLVISISKSSFLMYYLAFRSSCWISYWFKESSGPSKSDRWRGGLSSDGYGSRGKKWLKAFWTTLGAYTESCVKEVLITLNSEDDWRLLSFLDGESSRVI